MEIPDVQRAEHYLRHVSYYRLRAYWLPFEVPAPLDGDHMFRPGTSLEDVIALYVFDRQLRLHVMDAIERIEVSLRAGWALHLAIKYGPHGYLDPDIYEKPDRYERAYKGATFRGWSRARASAFPAARVPSTSAGWRSRPAR